MAHVRSVTAGCCSRRLARAIIEPEVTIPAGRRFCSSLGREGEGANGASALPKPKVPELGTVRRTLGLEGGAGAGRAGHVLNEASRSPRSAAATHASGEGLPHVHGKGSQARHSGSAAWLFGKFTKDAIRRRDAGGGTRSGTTRGAVWGSCAAVEWARLGWTLRRLGRHRGSVEGLPTRSNQG